MRRRSVKVSSFACQLVARCFWVCLKCHCGESFYLLCLVARIIASPRTPDSPLRHSLGKAYYCYRVRVCPQDPTNPLFLDQDCTLSVQVLMVLALVVRLSRHNLRWSLAPVGASWLHYGLLHFSRHSLESNLADFVRNLHLWCYKLDFLLPDDPLSTCSFFSQYHHFGSSVVSPYNPTVSYLDRSFPTGAVRYFLAFAEASTLFTHVRMKRNLCYIFHGRVNGLGSREVACAPLSC